MTRKSVIHDFQWRAQAKFLPCKCKKVRFCWIPSHVVILKNDIVDAAARETTLNSNVDIRRIPHVVMKSPIKIFILGIWQQKWSSPLPSP